LKTNCHFKSCAEFTIIAFVYVFLDLSRVWSCKLQFQLLTVNHYANQCKSCFGTLGALHCLGRKLTCLNNIMYACRNLFISHGSCDTAGQIAQCECTAAPIRSSVICHFNCWQWKLFTFLWVTCHILASSKCP